MKILFATDGSEYAANAARVLAGLEAKEPIHLSVLTVSYLPDNLHSSVTQSWYPQWREAEEARINEHYQQLTSLLGKIDGSVHMMRREGVPSHEILVTAEEEQADLIVVGAQGHSTLSRVLLGSVSDNIATHAKCSVLVIRENADSNKQTEAGFRNISLAFDGSQRAHAAADELLEFKWERSNIDIVSVAPIVDYLGSEYALQIPLEAHSESLQASAVKLRQAFIDDGDQATTKLERASHVGEAIVHAAEGTGANLIVTGDSGHSAIGRFLLGSTSKYVLRHAPCSVWISRHGLR